MWPSKLGKSAGYVCFSLLELNNAYNRLKTCDSTSKQCKFGNLGTVQYAQQNSKSHGLELNWYTIQKLLWRRDILSLKRTNRDNFWTESGKNEFFQKEIDCLGFKISEEGIRPLVVRADAIKKTFHYRKTFLNIDQFWLDKPIRETCPKLLNFEFPTPATFKQKFAYRLDNSHSIAFEKLKVETVNFSESSHFDFEGKNNTDDVRFM